MKILLIGASGFLGGHIHKYYLSKGDDVLTYSFRPYQSAKFLEQLEALIANNKIDVVINAGASQQGEDDVVALNDIIQSNIFFPAALASYILKYNPLTAILNFGSSWQLDGDGNYSPFNAYAASKTAAESFYEHFKLSGLRLATLRLYDTYGPNDDRKKIINILIDALIKNEELLISPGQQALDFIYIDDVIEAIDLIIQRLLESKTGIHEVYSIRSGNVVTVLKILEMLISLDSNRFKTNKIVIGGREYRNRERFYLSGETPSWPRDWQPKVKLLDGLDIVLKSRLGRT